MFERALTATQSAYILLAVCSHPSYTAMPSREESESVRQKRKRATSIEAAPTPDPPPQPPAKRQKRSRRSPSRTPPQFWDNLSQVPLTRRALREFNRRTVWPVTPKPPERSIVKGDLLKRLKRFARHGGPSLRNIRGVGSLNSQRSFPLISSLVSRAGNRRRTNLPDEFKSFTFKPVSIRK
jgi:hypothetical protein